MVRRKSLLIGINYEGSSHALRGCRQDVRNMVAFLQSRGFPTDERSMVVLADDRQGPYYPTVTRPRERRDKEHGLTMTHRA